MASNDDRPFTFDVQEHLSGVDYPAAKQDLLRSAEENNAPSDVMEVLNQMEDREYDGPTDVTQAIVDLD